MPGSARAVFVRFVPSWPGATQSPLRSFPGPVPHPPGNLQGPADVSRTFPTDHAWKVPPTGLREHSGNRGILMTPGS